MLTVEQLSKVFRDRKRGDIRAVDGVSFSCRPGEVFGLIGPNGAGKTTLLRMLATILQPTAGTATVAGYDIRDEPQQVRRNIGFLSGTTGVYERLTAREMVAYFGALFGLSPRQLDHRLREIFAELDMESFADQRCDRLSSGQKQRVSIARTIVHKPEVLFFDEPTNGLDVITARTIKRFIVRCRDEGRTVVFSTHIMSDAETICDRLAIIHGGRIVAVGTVEELRQRAGAQIFEHVFLRLIGEDYEQ
jgi:sodium transport system ATP-binding protein